MAKKLDLTDLANFDPTPAAAPAASGASAGPVQVPTGTLSPTQSNRVRSSTRTSLKNWPRPSKPAALTSRLRFGQRTPMANT